MIEMIKEIMPRTRLASPTPTILGVLELYKSEMYIINLKDFLIRLLTSKMRTGTSETLKPIYFGIEDLENNSKNNLARR